MATTTNTTDLERALADLALQDTDEDEDSDSFPLPFIASLDLEDH